MLERNSIALLERRYLSGGETVDSLWDRTSGGEPKYRALLEQLRFLPNSPTLFNAGLRNGCTLSACFPGGTPVWTIEGPVPIRDLVGRDTDVLSELDDGTLCFRKMHGVHRTREAAEVLRVHVKSKRGYASDAVWVDGEFTATPDHVVFRSSGREARVDALRPGDRLAAVKRRRADSYGHVALSNGRMSIVEHRLVMSHVTDLCYTNYEVHHINEDPADNRLSNLEYIALGEHRRKSVHTRWAKWDGYNPMTDSEVVAKKLATQRARRSRIAPEDNHVVVSVEPAAPCDVYDGEVEGTHKFYILTEADGGILVHNCFVFDIADSMFGKGSIVETRAKAVAVAKAGGGVGYYGGDIRRRGATIQSIHRKACGPVAVLKDLHAISMLITQGGKRELAQMFVLPEDHDDILEFIHCKDEDPQGLGSFNISTSWRHDRFRQALSGEGRYAELWAEQCKSAHAHGCPGVFFLDRVNFSNPNKHLGLMRAPNPCFVGETLVLTAQGPRRFDELAESRADVDVLCTGADGRVCVRTMRRPHCTARDVPVVKVTLDDGSTLRCTPDHELFVRGRGPVPASQLTPADSLELLTRYTKPGAYSAVCVDYPVFYKEHALIAEHAYGPRPEGCVVHHADEDPANNAPENLRYVTRGEHASLHHVAENFGDQAGECNANYSGVESEELVSRGRELVELLGRQFTRKEWGAYCRANGYQPGWGDFRGLGRFQEFARLCAGHLAHSLSTNAAKKYNAAVDAGLDVRIVDGKAVLIAVCDACGEHFHTERLDPDIDRVCSHGCSNRMRDTSKMRETLKATLDQKKERTREIQLQAYTALKAELGRRPEKREWAVVCKAMGATTDCTRAHAPFQSWRELCEAGDAYNHRVVSIEPDGTADVYNGCVDEHHNYYVGGWDVGLSKRAHQRTSWIRSRNCGETPNRSDEPCNLGSLVLGRYFSRGNRAVDWRLLEADIWTATEFLDDILDRNEFPHPDITAASLLTRKLGLGVMGWADLLAMMHIHYDTQEAVDLAGKLMGFIAEVSHGCSERLAKIKGPYLGYSDKTEGPMRRNETTTSIAPTGSIGIIAGCKGFSIEPWYAMENDRTTADGMKLTEAVPAWIRERLDGFVPKCAHEIAPEWHVRHQAAFQRHTDLGVSKTVNMPQSATVADVAAVYKLMFELDCKGGTVYRDGCRDEQVLVAKGRTKSVYSLSPSPASQTGRRKLPRVRTGKTYEFKVQGINYFCTVNVFEGGDPGEVFIACKEGNTVGGLLDAWAISLSVGLQNGVPLRELVRHHIGSRFEPCGPTGDPEVPVCTSVPDYVARLLMKHYGPPGAAPSQASGMVCPECGSAAVLIGGCLSCSCGWSKCG